METPLDYKKLKVGNYLRKSSEGEDKQVLSLGSQKDECHRTADFYKLPPVVDVYEEAKSAKLAGLRPEFTRMVKDIYSGKINTILCWHLNRIARNMTEGGMIIDLLSSGTLKAIITPHEVYNQNTDVSVISLYFGASKQYSKNLSKDVKRGQRTKASNGLPASQASLGFRNSLEGEKGTRWWYVDEERFWKVKKLLELFLDGNYPVRKLQRYAIAELNLTTPVKKKQGGRPIAIQSIYNMLKNPVYAGFFYTQGEKYPLRSDLPRMITEDQHERILRMIEDKKKPKVQKHKAVYSGFIFSNEGDFIGQDVKYQIICDCKHKFAYRNKTHCPKCDKAITKFENSKYFIQSYYYNNRKKKAGLDYKSIPESEIGVELLKYMKESLTLPTELCDWSKKYIYELKDKEVSENLYKVQDKEKRRADFELKKSRMRAMLRDGKITEEEYDQDLALLALEYKDTQNDVKTVDWMKEMSEMADITTVIIDILAKGSFEAKRNILTRLGSNLIWNDEKLLIDSKKSVNTLINGLKSVKPILSKFGNQKALVEQELNDNSSELCTTLRRLWVKYPHV